MINKNSAKTIAGDRRLQARESPKPACLLAEPLIIVQRIIFLHGWFAGQYGTNYMPSPNLTRCLIKRFQIRSKFAAIRLLLAG
jgi:hypothetical protein